MDKIDQSRRNFLKKMGAGTAGITFSGFLFDESISINSYLKNDKEINNLLIANDKFSPIFPIPQQAVYKEGTFQLTGKTKIVLTQNPSQHDKFLANQLRSILAENFGILLGIQTVTEKITIDNFILIGSSENVLLSQFGLGSQMTAECRNNPGGYSLKVSSKCIVIQGMTDEGAFYGLQSLRQLIDNNQPSEIPCVHIHDWPNKPFRGIRIYVPGPENIVFYKRFIRDFMAYFKYNKVILEMNACMRLDEHPELNSGGKEFYKDLIYTRRSRVTGPHEQIQNSTHHDAADGEILDKEQVADLGAYAKKFHIETIPEIPSLSHVYYLLTNHRELAEIKNAEWPDTYCPSNPDSRKLYFEVLDEYIEVMNPNMIHIGHDEWRMPTHVCENCKGKDYKELFIQDVTSIHQYLKKKNIRVAIWGDHLLVKRRTAELRPRTSPTGYEYSMPGAITPEQLMTRIPKDILVFNWSWKIYKPGRGEENDIQLSEAGFEQVHANFETIINEYKRRSKLAGLIGGAPSAWVATNELNFGKINLHKFIGCSNLLWSTHYHQEHEFLARYIKHIMPNVRTNIKGKKFPSQDGDPVVAINLNQSFIFGPSDSPEGLPLKYLKKGEVNVNNKHFQLGEVFSGNNAIVVGNYGQNGLSLPQRSKPIKIGKDVSSLLFLHACAHPAGNVNGFFKIHAF